ncbi:hypothetical protein GE061_007379 [Apolygus lucorum]|uniref:Uncharacterized protein n=1 Tax=Apolygus lucorum TaxID=248454 RepID=A0A6A4J6K5_APOLU|nr:hypothetical protein GE061_007379 [Apolygus lucorum]
MSVLSLARAALLLGLVYVCYSKPLSKKQIDYFKSHAEEWGAPAIEKVLNGTMEKVKKVKIMKMNYESEDDQLCSLVLRKFPKGKIAHGWNCASKPVSLKKDDEDEDDTDESDDDSDEKKKKHKKKKDKKKKKKKDEDDDDFD